jgi:hypothetical protein
MIVRLDTDLSKTGLSSRAVNALWNEHIETVRHLVEFEGDLTRLILIGPKTAKEIDDFLASNGYSRRVTFNGRKRPALRDTEITAITRIANRLGVDPEAVIAFINDQIQPAPQ